MNDKIRDGLVLVCVALIAAVIAVATRSGSEEVPLIGAAATLIAVVLGIFGLAIVALGLARRS